MGFRMFANSFLSTASEFKFSLNNGSFEVMKIQSDGSLFFPLNATRIRGECWTDYPRTSQLRFRRNSNASTFLTINASSVTGSAGINVHGTSSMSGLITRLYIQHSPLMAAWDAVSPFSNAGFSMEQAALLLMRADPPSGGIGIRFLFNDTTFRTQTGADIAASARFGLGAFTSGPRQRVMTGGTTAGTVTSAITVNNGSAEFVNLSDYRRKTNIEPMVDAVGTVKRLRPVWYNLRGFETDPLYAGFIAHEFQEVIRDGVTGYRDQVDEGGEPVYQLMDKRTAIPALVGAVQELRQRVEAARERLNTLKGNN
jgi:hypothetical protein